MTSGGVESLYPFLYDGQEDASALLDDVHRSTEEKASEIAGLRRSLAASHGEELVRCARAMAVRFKSGARLFTFGNGGSATDAQCLANLFAAPPAPARFPERSASGAEGAEPVSFSGGGGGSHPHLETARPLPAISLPHDVAALTALANDVGYADVFARRLAALATGDDIAIAFSTSGGSDNLIRALDEAGRRGLCTVGFAGYDGGRMGRLSRLDHLFVVPSSSVHRIQEAQTTLYHVLWELTTRMVDGRL